MIEKFNREVELPGTYQSPRVSSETMDCSLPMTFDHLSLCSLKCQFCFSFYSKSNNAMLAEGSSRRVPVNLRSADMPKMMLTMQGKDITDKRSQSLYNNFYKKKFILHWGGLADPFCNFEAYNMVGYPFINFLGEMNYPTLFSFKGSAILKKEYIQLFEKYSSQKNFAFQISMVTFDNEKSKNVEVGVPSPTVRLKIMKMLSQMGYWCLDKNTEIFHKINNSPCIRKTTLETLYKTGKPILVNCNGSWKEANPIRVPYNGYWYKITLRNGAEIIEIDKHLNFTFEGIKKGENICVGDCLLVSNKPMNWDCDRGTYELGRFVGLWIAEGCYIGNRNGFKFTFNSNEAEYIKFISDFTKNLGAGIVTQTFDNRTDVVIYSSYLKQLLDHFVSRTNLCSSIKLNKICYSMSKDFRKGLFVGWAEGDGNDGLQIHSISSDLLKDMFVLANTLGIKCSLREKKLQVCDTLTKNAKIYKFNATSGINYRIYCEVVKVEKFRNRRIDFAYCLEVPDGNRFELANGIITHNCILRLRPFILGITDETLDELLDAALKAGMKGVSTEFFALDARANVGMMERYKWLAEQTGIDNLLKYFAKLSPHERGTYRRLNWKVKEYWIKKIFLFCQKHDLVFGCSDPDFKELNSSGSCFAGNTEIFIKMERSPYIRKLSLLEIYFAYVRYKTKFEVLCNGEWKKAKPMRIPYGNRGWWKITLRNGSSFISTRDHLNFIKDGIKQTNMLDVGDFILMYDKEMPTDSTRGTYDLGRFVGLYLAEGSGALRTCKGNFQFTFSKEEHSLHSFIKSFIEHLGGHVSIGEPIKGYLGIGCYSKLVKSIISEFISGKTSRTKKLKSICFEMSKEFRNGLLHGWIEGDGSIKEGKYQGGATSSKQLSQDLFQLAMSLGLLASIRVEKRTNQNFSKNNLGRKNLIYVVGLNSTNIGNKITAQRIRYKTNKIYRQKYHRINNQTYTQVVKMEVVDINSSKYAYCLEVDNGNKFQLANGIITHNCCGLPDHFPANRGLENWSKNQLTYHLKEARKLYHKTGKQTILSFDGVYSKQATFLDDVEFHDDHVSVIGKSQPIRNATTVRHVISRHWNSLGSPANPRNYFDRILEPCGKDSKGYMLYKYNPRPYEVEWVKEGIDLTI